MRRKLLPPILAIATLGFVGALLAGGMESGSVEKSRQEVLKIEEEMGRAFADGDASVLDRIWADDVIYTGANGEVLPRAQYLARFKSGTRKFDSFAHDDILVRIYENMAILTGRSTSVLQDAGKTSSDHRRFTHIYVKQDGRWRLVAHQVTNIAKQ